MLLALPILLALAVSCEMSNQADVSIGILVDSKTGSTFVSYVSCGPGETQITVYSGDGDPSAPTSTTVWQATDTGQRTGLTSYQVGRERPFLDTSVPLADPLDPSATYTALIRQGQSSVQLSFSPEDATPGDVLTRSGRMSSSEFGDLSESACRSGD